MESGGGRETRMNEEERTTHVGEDRGREKENKEKKMRGVKRRRWLLYYKNDLNAEKGRGRV